MNKETILAYLNSDRRDDVLIITQYCLEQSKDIESIKYFIRALQLNAIYNIHIGRSLLDYCYDYALTYYIIKYNIVLIHDKNGKFIKAF